VPSTILPGPTSVNGYAAIIAEVVGSEGTYVPPTAQVPVSSATVRGAGGVMANDPVAGLRWANSEPLSTEILVTCDLDGPFTNAIDLLKATLGGATGGTAPYFAAPGNLPAYSIEVNIGGSASNSMRLSGACVDKYSLKGAVNGRVEYTASLKAQNLTSAVAGTPTAPVVTPFGLAEVAITGPGLAAVATAFQIDIDKGVKTQPVFSSAASKYVYSTTTAVTGKITSVMTTYADLTTFLANTGGSFVNIVVTLTNATGTKVLTMASCKFTELGASLKVGSNTLQDLSFIAYVHGGASGALVVT
jgi:hypothetical protein